MFCRKEIIRCQHEHNKKKNPEACVENTNPQQNMEIKTVIVDVFNL